MNLFGADGITVHPRPDERHIRRSDVYDLRPLLRTEFNIEGYPAPEFIDLVLKVKPHQVTLVPDDPSQITSNSGWDTKANLEFLTEVLDQFNSAGIRTSVFVAADPEMVEYAAKRERIVSNCIPNHTQRTIRRIRKLPSLLLSKPQRLPVNWVSD